MSHPLNLHCLEIVQFGIYFRKVSIIIAGGKVSARNPLLTTWLNDVQSSMSLMMFQAKHPLASLSIFVRYWHMKSLLFSALYPKKASFSCVLSSLKLHLLRSLGVSLSQSIFHFIFDIYLYTNHLNLIVKLVCISQGIFKTVF